MSHTMRKINYLANQFWFSNKLTLSLTDLTQPRKLPNLSNCPTKPNGVTAQTKALVEYFLMVVVTLLLNTVHAFANFMFI